MGFDLSQVLQQANQVSAESENSSGGKEKLIYPQNGKLKVRILFNPKSQVVIRKFERHTVNGTKVPCMANYGQDCPVCKILGDIKNAKGTDLYSFARKSRGICYAEYVASDYKWEKPEYEPKVGEIVMLMFPWTIYQDLNRIISSSGENLQKIVASNIGFCINIERYTENNQIKYKAAVDPFDTNHQTRNSDQEYNDLLMGLDSLNDKFVPIDLTDEILAKNREVAEQLSKEYLNPVQYTQPNVGQGGMNLGGVAQQFTPQNPVNQQMNNSPQLNQPNNMLMNNSQGFNQAPPIPQSTQDANGNWYDLINGQWVLRAPANQMPQNNQVPQNPASNNGMYPTQDGAYNNAPQGLPNQQNSAPVNTGKPVCFGKHGDSSINANQCMLCPNEAECQASK